MGRSAFVVRREGRYLFRTRWPRCLTPASGAASIRIALGTASYAVALRRASRIAAWALRIKAAKTLDQALSELNAVRCGMAARPVIDEDDLIERLALERIAHSVCTRLGVSRCDSNNPDKLTSWIAETNIPLSAETRRVAAILGQPNGSAPWSGACQPARVREAQLPALPLERSGFGGAIPAPVAAAGAPSPAELSGVVQRKADNPGVLRLRLSEVLQRFLDFRENQDGDRRAESEVAPIIKFAIALLDNPVMHEMNGDDLLKLKMAVPDIPTKYGFPFDASADLYFRWKHVQDRGWNFQRNGKELRFKRTSQTTIKSGWKIALRSVWEFAIAHRFAPAPAPDFDISAPKNPVAVERDAFRFQELYGFIASPPFTGCAGRARPWTSGKIYYQGFFYWGELIELLSGLRPAEIAQLRCRDILDLYGRPHIRFARFSIAQEEEARFSPQQGGNDGKTPAAYRWISLHWLLLRLGIIERRDAIVADYISRRIDEAGGRTGIPDDQFSEIERQAGDQWLFPDWPVYVKSTGEIKWSHALSKAFSYGLMKTKMRRPGLSQYSARHFFKGLIDDVKGLSERSRKIIMGHSTKGSVTNRYGPKMLTEQQSEVVQSLSSLEIWRLAKILIRAKRRAEKGELVVIDAWRTDMRSGDERFRKAWARKDDLYK